MSVAMAVEQRAGIYRGWSVVAAGFVCALLGIGATVYIFGLFVVPLTKEFGLSRANANSGLIALFIGMAVWSPIVGRALDRYSARVVMPIGAVAFAAGMVAVAQTHSLLVMLAAAVFPISFGISAGGSLAANTVTARWFRRRRGRAMGIMAVATSAGGFVVPPITAILIGELGWRPALTIVGIAAGAIIMAVALLVMRDRPSEAELFAAGELGESTAAEERADERGWSVAQMVRNRDFWLIMLGAGLLLASDQALIVTNVPYYLDKGVTLQAASMLIACGSASAIAGKLLVGFLAERIDIRRLFGAIAFFHMVYLVLYISYPGYWAMFTAACLIGVAVGGVYPVWMTLTARRFGSRSFGLVLGSMSLGVQPLSIASLRFVGEAFDRTGSYNAAFEIFLAAVAVSWLLIALVRVNPPPGEADWEPANRSSVRPATR